MIGPRLGEDAAVVDMGDRYLIATTDPVTFATDEVGWYALHVNANDVAVRGARPLWFLATVLLPEGLATEGGVERLFADLGEACAELGVALIGGHTEVTAGLPRAVVVRLHAGRGRQGPAGDHGRRAAGRHAAAHQGRAARGRGHRRARAGGRGRCGGACPPTW